MSWKSATVFKVHGSAFGGGGPLLSFVQPGFNAVTSDQGFFKAKKHFPTRNNVLVLVPSKGLQPSNFLQSVISRFLIFFETLWCSEIFAMITSSDSPSQLL